MNEGLHKKVEIALKVLGLIVASFAIVKFFLAQSYDTKVAAYERSMGMIEAHETSSAEEHRIKLIDYWIGHPQLAKMATADAVVLPGEIENYMEARVFSDDEFAKISPSILFFISRYEMAWFCRKSTACDQNILDEFFCPRVIRFEHFYSPILKSYASDLGQPTLAKGIEEYSNECER